MPKPKSKPKRKPAEAVGKRRNTEHAREADETGRAMVMDYSKWDHIDTGSSKEDEELPPLATDPAEGVGEARSGQAKEEKKVQCIRVHCDGEPGHWDVHWETLQLPVSHPILFAPIAPVSQRIGLPLRVYLEIPPNRARDDNQLITYLMIDPVSGFAPFLYQDGVGPALVCRSDLKPLSAHHLEAVWMFCSHLIHMYGYGPGAVLPNRDITPPKFEQFFRHYKNEKARIASSYRHIDYPNQDAENWQKHEKAEAVGVRRNTEQAKEEEPKRTAEGIGEKRSGQAKEEKTVQCIRVHCDGEYGHWETLEVLVSHPILSAPIAPVSQRIGLPLRVYLEKPLPKYSMSHATRAHYDNQLITYLMIDPVSGFAPFLYQAGVGTALVCRSDLKPLSHHHLEPVWMFCSHLIHMFGYGPHAVLPDRDITPPKFERFFRQYKDEKANQDIDDIRDIDYPNQEAENWFWAYVSFFLCCV